MDSGSVIQSLRPHLSALRRMLAAAAAWAITVLPIISADKSGSWLVRTAIVASILPGMVGPLLDSHRWARHVGLTLFLASVGGCWLWASHMGLLAELDLFRSALGSIAWGVFALSWMHRWSVPEHQLRDAPLGDAMDLEPRRRRPTSAIVIAVVGILLGLSCLAIPWRVDDPDRAVLAHTLAVVSAVAMITVSSSIAVIAGREDGRRRREVPMTRGTVTTLLMMVLVVVLLVVLHLGGHRQ